MFALILLSLVLIVNGPRVSAQTFGSDGNPGDTRSGEVISIFATNEAVYYQDGNLNDRSTNAATDISYTTSPEYGFSMNIDIADLNVVTPGDVVNHFTYLVTNEGNTTLPYTGSYYFEYGGGASGWTVEVWQTAGPIFQPLIAGTVSTESRTLNDDSDTGLTSRYYRVYVSPLAAESPDGGYVDVYTTYETTATPVGTYEGANTLWYGGTSEADDYFRDQIAAPLLVVTRTTTVDSPNLYKTHPAATDHDPVPGAVVTHNIQYSNLGNASAESVILVDRIITAEGAPGTNLAHINMAGSLDNVNLTGSSGDMYAGWTISYSTVTSPPMTYGATVDWTVIGTSDGANSFPGGTSLYAPSSSEYAATWIKFEKSSVATDEDGARIIWGVTIR